MFGSLLLFESVNYGIFLCLHCMFKSPDLLFKYHGFEWVGLFPGFGLEMVFLVMGLSAIGVMLGLYYRWSMLICTLCLAYLFLLDQALYLNHFYLALLFCGIMIVMPANAIWSLDAKRKRFPAFNTVPAWTRFWLIAQLEIVLLYAGIVKINMDWLNLEPMRLWMTNRSHDSIYFFQWITQDWGIAAASYGSILLHIVGAPLLLWRKTRLWVFFIYCFFHINNALVFNIGIFPWMTIAATLVFFDPDWPRQFYAWWQSKRNSEYKPPVAHYSAPTTASQSVANSTAAKIGSVFIVLFISAWLVVQVVLPLRHWSMPGDVAWNEAGHRFSWRMKLRSKRGRATFYVVKNDQAAIKVDPNSHINRRQVRKMACIPDLIWQYAKFLEEQYTTAESDEVKVYVDTLCSLNTREPVPLVNRLVDLTTIPRTEPVQNWILPNTKLLPKKFLPI